VIDSIDDGLLDRYVSGECSREEEARVLQWAGGDPERQARIVRARAVSDAVRSLNDRWDVDRAWARAQSVMRSADPGTRLSHAVQSFDDPSVDVEAAAAPLHKPRVSWSTATSYMLTVAACLTVAVGIAAWRALAVRRAVASAPESIATGPRQRVSVQLRDGSHVILGPESRLVQASQPGTGTREVDLEGAAYFDIVHDPSRPFVVVAHNLRIRDLGTKFSVDAYAGKPSPAHQPDSISARVAVTVGSVAIEAAGPEAMVHGFSSETPRATNTSIILRAGSVGRVDARGRISVDRASNVDQYVSWTSGTLTLDDVPLSEAIVRLEHWYGVPVRLSDPELACRHITAAFHDEPLTDALDELSLALHLRHIDATGSVTLTDSDSDRAGPARGERASPAREPCGARLPDPVGEAR
jgi:transmembrane sensor